MMSHLLTPVLNWVDERRNQDGKILGETNAINTAERPAFFLLSYSHLEEAMLYIHKL
jgi:hypothetical protein